MRLFDEISLRKLEHLSLSADSVRVGVMKGDRRSRKRGTSIEFADYRDYTQGDDLRRLDWNVFARLGRPFIKLTEEEEDLAVHLLVDTSGSMDWPLPDDDMDRGAENKLRYALQVAAALGYIGLSSGDLVVVTLLDSRGQRHWGPFRGRRNGWPLIQFLEANYAVLEQAADERSQRRTRLDQSLRDYALRSHRPGLVFLLSDLFSPGDYREGISAVQARGNEIVLLHLLSPDETEPELSGDLRLIDIETGEAAEVSLDTAVIDQYVARLDAWRAEVRDFCRPRGIHYAEVSTAVPWDKLVLQSLRQQGVVR